MRRHAIAAAVLTSLVLPPAARAQGAAAPIDPPAARYYDAGAGLSLDQAVAEARAREPMLRAARTEVHAAEGLRLQAALRPNPGVSFEHRSEPGGTDAQTALAVEWALELFRRGPRTAAAVHALDAARHGAADEERVLAAAVRMQYGQVLAAIRDVTIAGELVSALRRQHGVVRSRIAEGATPPLEGDLLEIELRRLEAERLQRMSRADAALIELKRLLGRDPAEGVLVSETLEQRVALDAVRVPAAAPDEVPAERPDVAAAHAEVRAAEARLDLARQEGRYDVSVFASYMRMDTGFMQRGVSEAGTLERIRGQVPLVAAGVTVMVPLWNRNQGSVAAAEAERTGAAARHEAALLRARSEVAAARAREAGARQALAIFTDAARSLARRNLDVLEQTYQLGRATVFDVLAEQRRWLDLEGAYTGALREAFDARTDAERAAGDLR